MNSVKLLGTKLIYRNILYFYTLISFIRNTQPKEWARFEKQCNSDPIRKFCVAFENAGDADGIVSEVILVEIHGQDLLLSIILLQAE